MGKPVLLSVDDDPGVSRAVARDLRRRYGEEFRVLRAGGPGVLYTTTSVSTSTFVEAIIVDSPGIDSTAPWPMESHDPRNTSNLTTPLSDFACP
jgi:hypothetical protein